MSNSNAILSTLSTFIILLCLSCSKNKMKDSSIPCIPTALTNNIIAFYPFANGSLNDVSGNNYNLINSGGAFPTSDRNGNNNCAIQFTYDSLTAQFLIYSNPIFLNNLSQYSISLWYQITDSLQISGYPSFLIIRDSSLIPCPDRYGQWSIDIFDCNKVLFSRTKDLWDITNPDTCPLPTNIWHHVVATFNSAGIVISLYIDGIFQDSQSGDANCGMSTAITQDIGDLFLGKDFNGKLDDVIILNKELNQQEVSSLFTMGSCCQ